MEISVKTLSLFIVILFTGLSAGLFYAWEVSVIPGTKQVDDLTYLKTMQSINRAIINPVFLMVFLGLVLIQIFSIFQFKGNIIFWILIAGTLVYTLGTVAVTIFGNVPLNESLDAINLSEINSSEINKLRQEYEKPWNRLHSIRTFFSILSFIIFDLILFLNSDIRGF